MKLVASILFLIVFLSGIPAFSQAEIAFFEGTSYDFGEVKEGTKVERVFKLQNIGNEPLVLADVRTTCGCTASEWPKEPILPGQSSEIKLVFDSQGKPGRQQKFATILCNGNITSIRVGLVGIVQPVD